ncbi:hypothetical protein PVK06_001349 [Gossypium arboreum]|uniref:Uncharacterized protein n=1 Tax=Gossypium arboreum TaxID=29729 RepID=A0ABR0R1S3_GOSAR|nr:hypothetical protein PVK06_001349 [Gossypium arboreum]
MRTRIGNIPKSKTHHCIVDQNENAHKLKNEIKKNKAKRIRRDLKARADEEDLERNYPSPQKRVDPRGEEDGSGLVKSIRHRFRSHRNKLKRRHIQSFKRVEIWLFSHSNPSFFFPQPTSAKSFGPRLHRPQPQAHSPFENNFQPRDPSFTLNLNEARRSQRKIREVRSPLACVGPWRGAYEGADVVVRC